GQVRGTEPFDHCLEERRRDGEVVRRAPSVTQRLPYRRERALVIIIPTHVLELGQKMVEGALVIDPARSLYAVRHAFAQTRQIPLREGDADYRDLQGASFSHRIESGKDHLVGEISRHTEEHQRVRTRRGHQTPRLLAAAGALKDLRPMRPKPLIAILADTFVSPADSKVNRKPNQFPNTWTSKCPVPAQRSHQHFIVSDSAFGFFHHRP